MTANRTYKQLFAAILFVLYAFVATPVQLWHQHKIPADSSIGNSDGKHQQLSQATDANAEGTCEICSHKYSTYNDDALSPVESSLISRSAKNGYYCLQAIVAPTLSLSNKGPPSLS